MKKNALTLMEVMIAISIIAFLGLIMLPVINESISEHSDKLSAIKANNSLKEIVEILLNNSSYYPTHNFAYFAKNDADLDEEDYWKFRNAFKDSIINARETECYIVVGDGAGMTATTEKTFCLIGNDNIIWGIPLTDFKTLKTMHTKNNGKDIYYVPLTVYPNSTPEMVKEAGNIYDNAIFYGLRQDGKLIFLDSVINDNIEDEDERQETIHIRTKKYIQAK